MARLKEEINSSIDSVKSLQWIGKLLGILPFDLNNLDDSKCRYLYPIFSIIIYITIYTFSAIGKMQLGEIQEPTVQIIDILSDIALTVANITAIVGINIIYGKELCDFLNDIRRVDVEFSCIKKNYKFSQIKFLIEFALYNVLFVLYYVYNIYTWTTSIGINIYKHFLIRDMQYYHTIILTILLRYYALAITIRFQILNKILQQINKPHDEGVATLMDNSDITWNMRKIMQIYTKLSIIVGNYNNIFGWQYVILYIVIVVNLLMPLNMVLVYGTGEKMMYGAKFGIEFILLCIIWCCLPVGMARALFTAGEQGSTAASNTADICYTLVHELSTSDKDLILKQELLELANQASIKAPKFSAAGFFNIDFAIAFSLVGSISSYLIVLIQFNK